MLTILSDAVSNNTGANDLEKMEDQSVHAINERKPSGSALDRRQSDSQEDKVIFSALEVGRCQREMIDPVPIQTEMMEMENIFRTNPNLDYVPVQDDQAKIVAYIIRERFLAFWGQSPFNRDLFMKPGYTIRPIVDPNVIVLDSHTTLYEASNKLMKRDPDRLYDPFIITHGGKYFGMSTVRSVMDGLNSFSSRNMASCSSAQQAILIQPETFRKEKFNIHYVLDEVEDLGGDLIYMNTLRKDQHFIAAFDVCGKGLKASNMVMTIQALFKASFELFMLLHLKKRNPKMVMHLLNKLNRMTAINTPFDMYATGVAFLVNTKKKLLDFYDFGHTPVYLIRNGKIKLLPVKEPKISTGMSFFGIDPDLVVEPNRIQLQPGDKIFVHSDGLDEGRNISGEEYGEKRIIAKLKQKADLEPKELLDFMKNDLEQFRDGMRVLDDLTMLCFSVT